MMRVRGIALSIASVCALLATPAMATHYWELAPSSDPALAFGTWTMVGGQASPAGIAFTLKGNSANQPIALTLIATEPARPLHLSAFKDDGQSFLDKDTDAKGLLRVRFRTADTMNFKVTGPAGSTYQLSLWRGPAIVLPRTDAVVAMDALTGHAKGEASASSAPAAGSPAAPSAPVASAATVPATPADGHSNLLIGVLLGGILFVLVVIAVLIARGQKQRGNP